MKHFVKIWGAGALLVCLLAACGSEAWLNVERGVLFHSLEIQSGDPITACLEASLEKGEGAFLYLETTAETEGILRYTYTTYDRPGGILGCQDADGDRREWELTAATEPVFDAFWFQEDLTLPAGTTVFFVSGERLDCKLRLELAGLDPGEVVYVGMTPSEEVEEGTEPL